MELNLKHGKAFLDDSDAWVLDGWWWWSQASARPKGVRAGDKIYVVGRPHKLAAAERAQLIDIASCFPMHRLILGLRRYSEDRRDVDHIDGDGLNNRRSNLRVPTTTERMPATSRAQNLANSGSRGGTSRFKGVSSCRQTGRWKVQICVDGRNRNLGRYETEEEAAMVYNTAALEAWGEHARLNIVEVRG